MPRRRNPQPTLETTAPVAPRTFAQRWWGKVLLLLLGVLLLSLAFAPFKQFYAAWVGLVPWVVVLRNTRGPWRAAWWSWVGGTLFFIANMWWLAAISVPGMVALMAMLGLFWAVAGVALWPVVRGVRVGDVADVPGSRLGRFMASPVGFVLTFAVVWVGVEWARGGFPFGGLAWLYLAHSQTPALVLCQVADLAGELGVSFWVAMLNALAALFILGGWRVRGLVAPAAATFVTIAVVAGYGAWRFAEYDAVTTPGPTVLVVQSNYPQDNSGRKGVSTEETIDFHVSRTESALKAAQARGEQVDLVVWSETMMPSLTAESRQAWDRLVDSVRRQWTAELDAHLAKLPPAQRAKVEPERRASLDFDVVKLDDKMNLKQAHKLLVGLAARHKVGLIVGSGVVGDYKLENDRILPLRPRNSAVFYQRDDDRRSADPSDAGRPVATYDKIHLLPFGEYMPFRHTVPWIYGIVVALGPPDLDSYQLDRGDRYVVFNLPQARLLPPGTPAADTQAAGSAVPHWRFVTPICFEDVDGPLCARLVRGGGGRGSLGGGGKRADLLVNLTNDGWFQFSQMPQHLQVATFRSIENRVPTARSVNTGISGFIDSMGRTPPELLIPVNTPRPDDKAEAAVRTHRLMLDNRTTFFTRYGSILGPACGLVVAAMLLAHASRRLARRRAAE